MMAAKPESDEYWPKGMERICGGWLKKKNQVLHREGASSPSKSSVRLRYCQPRTMAAERMDRQARKSKCYCICSRKKSFLPPWGTKLSLIFTLQVSLETTLCPILR
jgi:hypothetical protein